jgi:small subunit ribosomal protein S21
VLSGYRWLKPQARGSPGELQGRATDGTTPEQGASLGKVEQIRAFGTLPFGHGLGASRSWLLFPLNFQGFRREWRIGRFPGKIVNRIASMIKVKSRGNETAEQMLRRFKKMCEKEGLTKDIKRVAYYEKPSEKRRRRARKTPRPGLAMRG